MQNGDVIKCSNIISTIGIENTYKNLLKEEEYSL